MIALLIGGTVVLCMGLLAVVYGVPIKEFSFGNTMIIAGSVVACTGLMLIGLSLVGRELKSLMRRLEDGVAIPVIPPVDVPVAAPPARPVAPPQDLARDEAPELPPARPPLRPAPMREDTLFARDQPLEQEQDRFQLKTRPDPAEDALLSPDVPAKPVRRNIMFSSHRRDLKNQDSSASDDARSVSDDSHDQSVGRQPRDLDSSAFAAAWPQPSRSRSEPPVSQSGRIVPSPEAEPDQPEPPRSADAPPVTVVKSGVVDSMAYSLYSDGSIEAQMPEGMVRFASIDELRAHLDQRG